MAEIYDITAGKLRPVTQADVDGLVQTATTFGLMRRILRKMLDFPRAVPVTDEELKRHNELLAKMCDLIENGHIETPSQSGPAASA